ncbi:putative mitochondrial protein [Cucumis melo var. makuwa]|uniref:Mitochondrial protein n=1 Tax=Cucumis melo var. makuwa TaxID=1194695 RepID=A0A5A7VCA7_CUCMM|nr:putative mitochondrial protein [Cucumis melo var. makuwa]TYK28041.1 putative mitochondrial protein [Cucumis melo var. makuwa]
MKPGEKGKEVHVQTLLRNSLDPTERFEEDRLQSMKKASSFFLWKPPIHSRSSLLMGSRLISLPLATKMFQFAKFEKSKEYRVAIELEYGSPIKDPWITDEISPWPFASKIVLPFQCLGIRPMHYFLYNRVD